MTIGNIGHLALARKRMITLAILAAFALSLFTGALNSVVESSTGNVVGVAYDNWKAGNLSDENFTATMRVVTAVASAAAGLLPEAEAHSTWVCYETGWFYDDAAHPDAWVNIDVIGSGPNGSISVRHHHLWVDGREDFSYHTCYT